MESIDSGHDGDAADRIYGTIEILVVEEKKIRRHVHQFLPSIYRVSKTLRDVSPNSYTPRVISIGPFHEEDKNLKGVEAHKVTYLLDLYRRLKSPREQTMKSCVNMVLTKIDRIKACYDGNMKTYDDHEFAKMMELVLDNDEADTNHDHILGVLQKCYQHAHAIPSEISKTSSNSAAEFSNSISYSATELAMAGVKFKPNNDTKWLLAMEFKSSRVQCFCWSWGKPTFRMPLLQIEDYTEAVLRNLIAYEQFSSAVANYVTSYSFAMERILDTKEDIVKVIESKVLVNNLGSSEQASNMINSICKEVTVKDFSYTKQWQQLDDYYNGYWPKNIARLRRTYFSSPWSFIALLAGFLLFGLTVAQTYFTIRPI
ncbi:hypothetical protein L6452_02480 [Arctium lappa]|uniref:Uncharacterized protein n=1 Tax=Arctium lappa TaxID=4217 RepID=A0ACB9FKJ7_ARCLA|nr:hypothetical protein L6452_02480 [Arctium lappa]